MADNKRQHYVPRFYLRGFTPANEEYLYVFDKKENTIFRKNIQEICEQNYYYSFYENEEYNFMLEEHLSKKEYEFSGAFSNIIENIEGYYFNKRCSIKNITHTDKRLIIEFICYQILRVPKYMESLFAMTIPQFKKFNREDGITQTEKEIKNDIKKYVYPHFFDRTEEMMLMLLRKNWIFLILASDLDISFISSDNPVMITNSDLNSPIRGAIIDPMTEIAIPISKHIALALKQKNVEYRLNYTLIKTMDRARYTNNLLLGNTFRFAYSEKRELLER